MIINIRGTHGSGKSTIMFNLLQRYESSVESVDERGRPRGYIVSVPFLDRPVLIVGAYKTACGGCDGIQPYTLIWPRIVEYAQKGHVLFEGALVSSSYGNIGRASEIYGDDMVFAFMDTPVETCIQWILKRREAKGNTQPFSDKNTRSKHECVARSIPKIRDEFKRRVVVLDHRKATSQVLGLLRNA